MKYIGAHIKKESGHLLKTINIIKKAGGNALQLFVSNPRSASIPNIQAYEAIADEINTFCATHDFKLVIHSSYTINLAKEPKVGKKTLDLADCYWIQLLLAELQVSEMIHSVGVVVHVGKYTNQKPENGVMHMFAAIKYILHQMQGRKMKTRLILETPAGQGTELLTTLEEFITFYNQFSAKDKQNLGICLDTAHIWSSGYDITDYYNIISATNASDIAVIHFNNSKKEKGSRVDAHETLLEKSAKIPLQDMHNFLQHVKPNHMIILETPGDDVAKEISWILQVQTSSSHA
jgi:deoxyribonuclease-4